MWGPQSILETLGQEVGERSLKSPLLISFSSPCSKGDYCSIWEVAGLTLEPRHWVIKISLTTTQEHEPDGCECPLKSAQTLSPGEQRTLRGDGTSGLCGSECSIFRTVRLHSRPPVGTKPCDLHASLFKTVNNVCSI